MIVVITAAGETLIRRHAAASAAICARIEAGFGAGRLETLLNLLEDLQRLDLRAPDQPRA